MGFDVIGDIHGQAAKLAALLTALGYARSRHTWVPPRDRQAVFLGDLIDRGPAQLEVVDTVRSMIDAGHARSVMGNHEFNAIGYLTPRDGAPGEFLRRHSANNRSQHATFLDQVVEGSARHHATVAWFRTLPPFLDLGAIRVVHAWWQQPFVDILAAEWPAGSAMPDAFLQSSGVRGSRQWQAMEGLTKGLEVRLPPGSSFFDHSGVERHDVRARWWRESPRTFRDVAIVDDDQAHRIGDAELPIDYVGSPVTGAPVFIGHYWMSGAPCLQSPKVACVDYSAAKDGPLVAYRWDGEDVLDEKRFVVAG